MMALLMGCGGVIASHAESGAHADSFGVRTFSKASPGGPLPEGWQPLSLPSGNIFTKAGDDYAARIYVFFNYDIDRLPFAQRMKIRMARLIYGQDLPVAALCYVWDNRAPIGTSVWNAYTDRVRMIVVESGDARLNEWISERRNVRDDYKAAFGEDPPAISGIAVGADTDNTGESTLSFFGDLSFSAPSR